MRALVIEDDVLVRQSVCDLLRADGIECEEAADAAAAMALLGRDDGWQPDVVVIDFDLGPGPTGADLATELLEQRPELGVVHATGSPERFAARPLSKRERLMAKPFMSRDLTSAIHTLGLLDDPAIPIVADGGCATIGAPNSTPEPGGRIA